MSEGRVFLNLAEDGPSRQEADAELVILDAAGEEEPHRVQVTCELESLGTRLHLRAVVSSQARSRCHRCLADFERQVEARFQLVLQRGGTSGDEDVVVIPEHVHEYDLAPRVREALILEEPLRLVCSPDCRGLCPQCGADLNAAACSCPPVLEPRWEALRGLSESLGS